MNKRNRILLAALPVAFLAWFAWQMLRPREPVYQGKPLSVWLEGYDPYNRDGNREGPISRGEANRAVRELGSNAIPTLLSMLRMRDSDLKRKLLALARKHHLSTNQYISAFKWNAEATMGLKALGADARSAVPALIEMYDHNDSSQKLIRFQIASVLGSIGPPAKQAIPLLLRGASDPNDPHRTSALCALRDIHAEPELVVPAMIEFIADPSPIVRTIAAEGLFSFGAEAKSAVPALIQSLNDTDERARAAAKYALRKIDPEAAAKAGVK